MPYHIKKQNFIDPSVTLYYQGGTRWTIDYSKRNQYSTKSGADNRADNSNNDNGGFNGSSVVEE